LAQPSRIRDILVKKEIIPDAVPRRSSAGKREEKNVEGENPAPSRSSALDRKRVNRSRNLPQTHNEQVSL